MTASSTPHRVDGRAARWAGQHERRRREFVDAALRAIAEHGPEVSTEQIAEQAGVARTRLYKHFTDTPDLQAAISERTVELITAELLPALDPQRTPVQMVRGVISAHIGWLVEHDNLFRYLTRYAVSSRSGGRDAFTDTKSAIAGHLTLMFEHYLGAFGMDTRVAEMSAFGVVGLVESSTSRWVEHPGGMDREELADLLTGWVWRLIDDVLRSGGVELDPHEPLAAQELSARGG
ncbi:TetR/AcrR family transcriptional regulator [Saccharopolyspora taberi]|uniref:TetR/AcrR family transcriptional regulator n=1 Tax=Saccharopolyspora taberi TaxID=60895 RepID=A0ABN3V9U0_9PSEU